MRSRCPVVIGFAFVSGPFPFRFTGKATLEIILKCEAPNDSGSSINFSSGTMDVSLR